MKKEIKDQLLGQNNPSRLNTTRYPTKNEGINSKRKTDATTLNLKFGVGIFYYEYTAYHGPRL